MWDERAKFAHHFKVDYTNVLVAIGAAWCFLNVLWGLYLYISRNQNKEKKD
jgi:hypothetical protein